MLPGDLRVLRYAPSRGLARFSAAEWIEMEDERYRLLFDASIDYAIFLVSLDNVIESWNPGAERIFRYSAEEIIGRHGSILFVPEDVFRGEPEREAKYAAETGRTAPGSGPTA
jgi:PAS domain-containing protein